MEPKYLRLRVKVDVVKLTTADTGTVTGVAYFG